MTTQILEYVGLSERDRKSVRTLPKVKKKGDIVEVRLVLPARAAQLIEAVVEHLNRGTKLAILADDEEISPNAAAAILGISRPLVVHRMEVGDLPFHYVGKHRRAKLKDVLALKRKLEQGRKAMQALADDGETLTRTHGV